MLNSMEQLIRSQQMIPPGSTVLCAVSGGADSICLLHALYHLREELGFTLAGVHHRTGYKNGKWLDVVDMERCLEGVDPPAPVRGMDVLTEQQREEILCRYAKTIR